MIAQIHASVDFASVSRRAAFDPRTLSAGRVWCRSDDPGALKAAATADYSGVQGCPPHEERLGELPVFLRQGSGRTAAPARGSRRHGRRCRRVSPRRRARCRAEQGRVRARPVHAGRAGGEGRKARRDARRLPEGLRGCLPRLIHRPRHPAVPYRSWRSSMTKESQIGLSNFWWTSSDGFQTLPSRSNLHLTRKNRSLLHPGGRGRKDLFDRWYSGNCPFTRKSDGFQTLGG